MKTTKEYMAIPPLAVARKRMAAAAAEYKEARMAVREDARWGRPSSRLLRREVYAGQVWDGARRNLDLAICAANRADPNWIT